MISSSVAHPDYLDFSFEVQYAGLDGWGNPTWVSTGETNGHVGSFNYITPLDVLDVTYLLSCGTGPGRFNVGLVFMSPGGPWNLQLNDGSVDDDTGIGGVSAWCGETSGSGDGSKDPTGTYDDMTLNDQVLGQDSQTIGSLEVTW